MHSVAQLRRWLRRFLGQIVLAEVLAVGRQLVVHKMGQDLLELEEEAFAGGFAVGVHVEGQPPLF